MLGEGEAGTGLTCFPRDGPHKCPSGQGSKRKGLGLVVGGGGRERSKGGIYEDRICRKLFQSLPCTEWIRIPFSRNITLDARQHFTFKRQ